MAYDRIAVLGAGAWGTALANVLARAGRTVTLWARDQQSADAIAFTRQSPRLPGVRLESRITVTPAMSDAAEADAILLAVPAQALRAVAAAFAPVAPKGIPAIACAKGIEQGTRRFMTEVIAEAMPQRSPSDPLGPKLRNRRCARAADGGDACHRR